MNRILLIFVLSLSLFGCSAPTTEAPPPELQLTDAVVEVFFASPPLGPADKRPNMRSQANGALADLRNQLVSKGFSLQGCRAIKAYVRGQGLMPADFDGFLFAYSRVFGTRLNPNQPDLIQIEVSGFAEPGQLVVVEAVCAKAAS